MVSICCKKETYKVEDVISQYKLLKEKKRVENKFYAILMQAVGMITMNAHLIIATTVKSKSINSKLDQYFHYRPHVAILD
jgi:hypothetical protein